MITIRKPLIFLLLVVIFTLIAVTYFKRIEIEDVWYHLKTGEIIITQGVLPFYDSYSYTSNNTEWLATQWLGDVIFYLLYRFFGVLGLQLFRCIFFTSVLVLLFFFLRRRLSISTALLFTLTVSFALYNRLLCRPFIFSYLFIILYFYILTAHHRNPSKKIILAIPLLQFFWQNIYMGGAYLSLFMVGIFLVGSYFDYGLPRLSPYRAKESSVNKQLGLGERKDLFLLIGACLICALGNPYGIRGLWYPLGIFFTPHPADMLIGKKFISEWQPSFRTFSDLFSFNRVTYKTLIIVTAVSLFLRRKKVCQTQALLFILFLLFSLQAVRLQDSFSILAACIFAESFFDCRGLFIPASGNRLRQRIWLKRSAKIFCGLFLFIVLVLRNIDFLTASLIQAGRKFKRYGVGIDFEKNPQRALNFLDEHKLYGNIYNSDILGGFIIAKGFPKRKVFIDGRFDLYSASGVFQKILLLRQPKYWEKLVKEYDIAIVILVTDSGVDHNLNVARYVLASDKWTCAYIDGACVIFLRNDRFPAELLKTHGIDLFQKREFSAQDLREYENNSARYTANPFLRWVLGRVNNYPEPLEFVTKGNWLINIGFFDQAIAQYLKALEINPLLKEGDFWLGYCLYKKGMLEYAQVFAKRALQIDPGNPDVLLLSAELEKNRDAQKAIYYYRQALRRRPNAIITRGMLANFAFVKGLNKEALKHYLWLYRVMPERVDYQVRLGALYGRLKHFNKARQVLEQAIARDPQNTDAHFNLAIAYRYLGLMDLCKKELENTVSIDPRHHQARRYLLELGP